MPRRMGRITKAVGPCPATGAARRGKRPAADESADEDDVPLGSQSTAQLGQRSKRVRPSTPQHASRLDADEECEQQSSSEGSGGDEYQPSDSERAGDEQEHDDEEDAVNSADDGVVVAKRRASRGGQAVNPSETVRTRSSGKTGPDPFSQRRLKSGNKPTNSVKRRVSRTQQQSQEQSPDLESEDESAEEEVEEESVEAEEGDADIEDAPARPSGKRRSGRTAKASPAGRKVRSGPSSSYDPESEEDLTSEAGGFDEGSTSTSEDDSEPPDAAELAGGGLVADEQEGDSKDEDEDAADDSSADSSDADAAAIQKATLGGRTAAASEVFRTCGAARAKGQTPAAAPASGPRRRSNDKAAEGTSGAARLNPGRQQSEVEPADAEEEEQMDDAEDSDEDDEEFIVNEEEHSPETSDRDGGSGPPSPLLLEPRDPDAPPPDWNLARDPVPDMEARGLRRDPPMTTRKSGRASTSAAVGDQRATSRQSAVEASGQAAAAAAAPSDGRAAPVKRASARGGAAELKDSDTVPSSRTKRKQKVPVLELSSGKEDED